MFLSNASGRCARILSARSGAHILRRRPIQRSILPTTTCTPSPLRAPIAGAQRATYAAATNSGNESNIRPYQNVGRQNPAYRYPESLNVFNAGSAPVVASGTIRLMCFAVFGYGVLYSAPVIFLDGAAPWYTAPLIALGSAIPLLATGIFWGGYVHHINILLPSIARRSKDDLTRFTSNLPPSAIVQVKSMWFRPWPQTQEVFFEDFRRLPRSRWRLSNLEHTRRGNAEVAEKNPMANWIVKKVMGTYFVNMLQFKDRSRAPGIWHKIWQQIPMAGAAYVVREDVERRAVLPSNRAVPVSKNPPQKPIESRPSRGSKMSKRTSRPTPNP